MSEHYFHQDDADDEVFQYNVPKGLWKDSPITKGLQAKIKKLEEEADERVDGRVRE